MKRAPMKRSAPKAWKLELDRLCRQVTLERDGGKCCRCGDRTRLQWCHVSTRAILSLRWHLDNVLMLCAGCHLWNHHQPTAFAKWWGETYPDRARRLMCRSGQQRVDPELIRLYLLQQS